MTIDEVKNKKEVLSLFPDALLRLIPDSILDDMLQAFLTAAMIKRKEALPDPLDTRVDYRSNVYGQFTRVEYGDEVYDISQ